MKLSCFVATGLALAVASKRSVGTVLADAKPAPSAEQLSTVPGVGPKLAARIVEPRQKEGAFRSVAELMNVKDIVHFS